jgi:hypothetical protein
MKKQQVKKGRKSRRGRRTTKSLEGGEEQTKSLEGGEEPQKV